MLRQNDGPDLARLLEEAGLSQSPGVLSLARAASRSSNPKWGERLMKIIQRRTATATVVHPYAPSPTADELPQDGVSLGRVLLADSTLGPEVWLPVEQFCSGTIVLGTNGSGKSSLMLHLCRQLALRGNVRVWIFDREEEAPSKLASELKHGKFRYVHYRRFLRNALEPVAGESIKELINRLNSYWFTDLTLGDGSWNILSRAIHAVMERRDQAQDGWPTLWHLDRELQKMRSALDARERGYWETATNRITVLLLLMSEVYDNARGFDLEKLLDENIIVDLSGISDIHPRFFVADLASAAMAIRERRPSETVNIFVIDELHRFVRSGPAGETWRPFIYELSRIGRKRGLGLLCADQVPSQVPTPVMANMSSRIALRTVNGPCKESISRSMSLTYEQRDWISGMPMRTAVVHSDLPLQAVCDCRA